MGYRGAERFSHALGTQTAPQLLFLRYCHDAPPPLVYPAHVDHMRLLLLLLLSWRGRSLSERVEEGPQSAWPQSAWKRGLRAWKRGLSTWKRGLRARGRGAARLLQAGRVGCQQEEQPLLLLPLLGPPPLLLLLLLLLLPPTYAGARAPTAMARPAESFCAMAKEGVSMQVPLTAATSPPPTTLLSPHLKASASGPSAKSYSPSAPQGSCAGAVYIVVKRHCRPGTGHVNKHPARRW